LANPTSLLFAGTIFTGAMTLFRNKQYSYHLYRPPVKNKYRESCWHRISVQIYNPPIASRDNQIIKTRFIFHRSSGSSIFYFSFDGTQLDSNAFCEVTAWISVGVRILSY